MAIPNETLNQVTMTDRVPGHMIYYCATILAKSFQTILEPVKDTGWDPRGRRWCAEWHKDRSEVFYDLYKDMNNRFGKSWHTIHSNGRSPENHDSTITGPLILSALGAERAAAW